MRWLFSIILISSVAGRLCADEKSDFFERKIRPVLIEHCYACHSAEGTDVEGGLRLDSRDAMRRGGESGPAVMPERVDKSLLVSAIKYESLKMPPDHKLSEEVVKDFETWIEQGAVDPRDEVVSPIEEVVSTIDYEQGRQFWSFQAPRRHSLPTHDLESWCRTRIDHFVAKQLSEAELEPNVPADSRVLLRRLTFDLTGLPPTDEQLAVNRQLDDDTNLSALIDELLGSASFGEHWARMWLDVMRFADDQAHIVGENSSLFFPNSYRYRDWVIEAFNRDMSYRRFIELQLAADLITADNPDDDVALGFVGLGPKYYRRNSPEVMAEEWEDRVDVLSRGLLGLTVACARCHDHKYDPIGTADYYGLAGVFASVEMFNRPLTDECKVDEQGEAKEACDGLHIIRDRSPTDLSIMVRGDVNRKGPVVPRRFLTVLSQATPAAFQNGTGRIELAKAIASSKNPLTARVFVNRVWARLIGRPIVGTPSNFGKLGEPPTHPELLDDLAVRFMQNNWSLKWLCREIVMSATYRQSSQWRSDGLAVDQDNKLLWRMNRKRLSVEQMRDAILAASGKLDLLVGGPSSDPKDPASTRRTLYSHASRLKLNPMLALFDYPDPNAHSEKRAVTTTPSQKLFLLNSPFMVDTANSLAARLHRDASRPEEWIERVYQLVFSRSPNPEERSIGLRYLVESQSDEEENQKGLPNVQNNLPKYAHALLIANEMLFLE